MDISNDDIRAAIARWVNGPRAERNRAILERRLIDGIFFEPLAEEFDLSVRQVKNIVYKYGEKVLRHLK